MDWNLKMFYKQLQSEDAKKNLVKIPLNGQSVPHEQKVNWLRVFLIPASHGTGVWWWVFVQFRISRYS
jgi:hypothetical protein